MQAIGSFLSYAKQGPGAVCGASAPGSRVAVALCALLLAAVAPAHGQSENVLWTFANTPDGATPRYVTPLLDAKGNIYGTTNYGGTNGVGAVFEVTSSGSEKILYSFNANGSDGFYPEAGLVMDTHGNFYGTTVEGGTFVIDGAVYKLAPTKKGYKESILHSFGAVGDGQQPNCALALDSAGNLYGTTFYGGLYSNGTVFEVTSAGTETVLWSLGNGTDGSNPIAGVIRDANGTLYGTTEHGGTQGLGTVFELTSAGTEKVLWSFRSGTDGAYPVGGVIRDTKGNLYGTTSAGGMYGAGSVFKVTPAGKEMLIHSFENNDLDGVTPYGGLVMDKARNLYGTTVAGGGAGGVSGIVFELTLAGAETILHNFGAAGDGAFPWGGLALDKSGNLYGVTLQGGILENVGTVFEVTP